MCEILELKKADAIEAFKNGNDSEKALLKKLYPKAFRPEKVTDRIKTFEDALEEVGCDETMKPILNYAGYNKDLIATQAFLKLTIIARSLNEGWTPDWKDGSYKYHVWCTMGDKSGAGFSCLDCDAWYSRSDVGSRLCFKSAELARYAGTQFTGLFKDMMVL